MSGWQPPQVWIGRQCKTPMLLWEEHRADYADRHTYSYSQFCENYRQFAR